MGADDRNVYMMPPRCTGIIFKTGGAFFRQPVVSPCHQRVLWYRVAIRSAKTHSPANSWVWAVVIWPASRAEFNPSLIHKRCTGGGEGRNPRKSQQCLPVYLVQGKNDRHWRLTRWRYRVRNTNPGFHIPMHSATYIKTIGGTAFLDMNYTVLERLKKVWTWSIRLPPHPTAPGDRPLQDIRMKNWKSSNNIGSHRQKLNLHTFKQLIRTTMNFQPTCVTKDHEWIAWKAILPQ